jgi:hypothetical protein
MFGIRKIIQVLQSERPKSNTNVAIFGITKLEYRMLGTYRPQADKVEARVPKLARVQDRSMDRPVTGLPQCAIQYFRGML